MRRFLHALSALVLAAILAGIALAQAQPAGAEGQPLPTPTAVAKLIDAAQNEILLQATTLQQHDIADALRRAVVQRGVAVFVLVSPRGANEPASYTQGLALAGAHVRVATVTTNVMIIDRTYVAHGLLLARAPRPGENASPTRYTQTRQAATDASAAFVTAFQRAAVFKYVFQPPH